MPRFRALAAVHQREKEPIEFVGSLRRNPIPNVSPRLALIGGIQGVDQEGLDFTDPSQNFAWNLPGIAGSELRLSLVPEATVEEGRGRSRWVYPPRGEAELARRRKLEREVLVKRRAGEVALQGWLYAGTMDIHTILGNCTRFAQIDGEYGVSKVMLGALKTIGMQRIVRMSTYGGTPHYSPNTAVVELQAKEFASSEKRMRTALNDMANNPDAPIATPEEFTWFDLIPYSPNVKLGQPGPECLKGHTIESFRPLPEKIAKRILPEEIIERLGLPADIIGRLCLQGYSEDEANDKGYWTDLVVMGETPNNQGWPKPPEKPSFLNYYQVQVAPEWQQNGN
jgi:hypothetical protein